MFLICSQRRDGIRCRFEMVGSKSFEGRDHHWRNGRQLDVHRTAACEGDGGGCIPSKLVKHLELRDAFGDRRCISGGGVEPTLGNRSCENADIVRARFHGGKFGEVRFLQGRSRREEAQYGLRAWRVGEACHPSPPGRHTSNQGVPDDVFDTLQHDFTQDDSDSSQPALR